MKSEMVASWQKSYDKPRQCVEKQRHHSTSKGRNSQGYGLPGVHIPVAPPLESTLLPGPPSLSCALGNNACPLLTRVPNDSPPSRRMICFICSLMAVGSTSMSAQGTSVAPQALHFCLELTHSKILSAQRSFGGEWMRGEAAERGCAASGP